MESSESNLFIIFLLIIIATTGIANYFSDLSAYSTRSLFRADLMGGINSDTPTATEGDVPGIITGDGGTGGVGTLAGGDGGIGVGGTASADPTITSVNPSTVILREAATITATGTNLAGSTVTLNGAAVPANVTVTVTATTITLQVPAEVFTLAGAVTITARKTVNNVVKTTSGSFTIHNPVPVANGVSKPPNVTVPITTSTPGTFSIRVLGSGFVPTSGIRIGNSSIATTYVSPDTLRTTNEVIWTVGQKQISVINPGPGGGTSGAIGFTIAP